MGPTERSWLGFSLQLSGVAKPLQSGLGLPPVQETYLKVSTWTIPPIVGVGGLRSFGGGGGSFNGVVLLIVEQWQQSNNRSGTLVRRTELIRVSWGCTDWWRLAGLTTVWVQETGTVLCQHWVPGAGIVMDI